MFGGTWRFDMIFGHDSVLKRIEVDSVECKQLIADSRFETANWGRLGAWGIPGACVTAWSISIEYFRVAMGTFGTVLYRLLRKSGKQIVA